MRTVGLTLGIVAAFCIFGAARLAAQEKEEKLDMETLKSIRDEGMNRSQAMKTISQLTDVHGPRLTGSPQLVKAAEWTKNQLEEWKLANAHLEKWGPFGRGWTLERMNIAMVSPSYAPLIAYPKAWSPSTQKVVRGKVVYFDVKTEADLDKYKGKLHKAVVLMAPAREVKAVFSPLAQRQTDTSLLSLANSDTRRGGRPTLSTTSLPTGDPPAPTTQAAANAGASNTAGASAAATPAAATPAAATPAASTPAPNTPTNPNAPETRAQALLQNSKWQLIYEEGAAVVIEPGRGDGGTVFVQAATAAPNARTDAQRGEGRERAEGQSGQRRGQDPNANRPRVWAPDAPEMVPQVVMAVEQYNRLMRMLELGVDVELEVDILTKYHTEDLNCYNVVAEIPGTDLKDEVVMLGGHFDSWHTGTGATDNAIGCGVALEAMRILQAIGAKPRRTIRIALWTGEEQGLLGSRAYVTDHFGRQIPNPRQATASSSAGATTPGSEPAQPAASDTAAQPTAAPAVEQAPAAAAALRPASQGGNRYELKPEHEKFAAYFNLDNGGGKIRGIYAQGNDAVRNIFRTWFGPFADLGASTVSSSNTSGTDHLSFDAVGLPGFQFIQDPLEYNTRTHHSSMDVYDRLITDDVKQASVIMASFVYNAAMRDEKLPRKPLVGEVTTAPAGPTTSAPATPTAATTSTSSAAEAAPAN